MAAVYEQQFNIFKDYLIFSEQSLLQGRHQNAFVDNLTHCKDCSFRSVAGFKS